MPAAETLAGFQAIVKVTFDDKQVGHWDGVISSGPPLSK